MERTEELIGLLKRLNAGEDAAAVKSEAQEFLASITPTELSLAEQKLIEGGLSPEDLRNLCPMHMEMLGGELEEMKATLGRGHVLHTLVSEHEMILGFLDELDRVNSAVQRMQTYDAAGEEFTKLGEIADNLLGAEPHHQREEQVLFPEMEGRGVFGPPQVMRMEHEELRKRKHELKELAETIDKIEFGTFKGQLDAVATFIVLTLRDHIFKENNILYPTALQVVQEEDVWAKLKAECDKIGYCCFTPQAC